jgi:hypothetical protein
MKIQLTGDCRSFFAELQSCLPPQEICDSLLHRISVQLPNTLSARRRNHQRARELPTDSSPRHISRAAAGSDRVGLQIVLSFVNTPSTWRRRRRRRRRSGFRRSAIAVQLVLWRNLGICMYSARRIKEQGDELNCCWGEETGGRSW